MDEAAKDEARPSEFVEKILLVASQASDIILKYYKQSLDIAYKKDEFDPVTIADQESDDFIREQLRALFPNDQILSEENSNIPAGYSGRVWMVDPLDGTKDFIQGRDCFSINIGLLDNGRPIFGCVVIPARSQIFFAEQGKGAYQKIDNVYIKMHVSDVTEIAEARLITRNPNGETRPLETKTNLIPFKERIPEGSIGTKICLIACGKGEAHINTNFKASKWDTLGAQVILEEAGGIITDLEGHSLDYIQAPIMWERSFIASNNQILHHEILESLK